MAMVYMNAVSDLYMIYTCKKNMNFGELLNGRIWHQNASFLLQSDSKSKAFTNLEFTDIYG